MGQDVRVHDDAREKVGPDQTIRLHTKHTPTPDPSSTPVTPADVQALTNDLNASSPSPTPLATSAPTPAPSPDKPLVLPPGANGMPAMATSKQFEADIETEVQGTKADSHIYVDGGMVRSEISVMGIQTVVLVNQKEQKFTQLLPDQKMLIHVPWSDQLGKFFNPDGLNSGTWVLQPKGETVNGILCDVWKVTEASGEIEVVDLDAKTGQPVKIAADDGSFTVNWKNFKPGPIPPEKFTVPADYKEMDMPAGMKMPNLLPSGRLF
jgi:hypothetical protein